METENTPPVIPATVTPAPKVKKAALQEPEKQLEAVKAELLTTAPNKTLDVTNGEDAKAKIKDIVFFGNPDTWQLLSKASSKEEGWMKSTKALEIEHVGVVLQVSTQQGFSVAEALTFIPGAKIAVKNGIKYIRNN